MQTACVFIKIKHITTLISDGKSEEPTCNDYIKAAVENVQDYIEQKPKSARSMRSKSSKSSASRLSRAGAILIKQTSRPGSNQSEPQESKLIGKRAAFDAN